MLWYWQVSASASFFKIELNVFLDTLIQKIFIKIMKINNFRGELTDISAIKEALVSARVAWTVILVVSWARCSWVMKSQYQQNQTLSDQSSNLSEEKWMDDL